MLVTPAELAVILVEDCVVTVAAVANPFEEMVATLLLEDAQVTDCVRSMLVPSCRVPVHVYCSVCPDESDELVGTTDKDLKLATVTVRVVVPLIPVSD